MPAHAGAPGRLPPGAGPSHNRRTARSPHHLLVASLAALLLPVPARAQPDVPPDVPRDEPRGPLQGDPATDEPPELVLPPVSKVLQVRNAEAAGRFEEAARLLEGLWAETNDPRFLYHAGVARSRAGHHALALRHLLRWTQTVTSAGEPARRVVEARVAAERALTTPIRLRLAFGPGAPLPDADQAAATYTLTMEAPGGQGPPVMFTWSGSSSQELRVDAGAWQVRAEAPGLRPAPGRFVAAGPSEQVWELLVARPQVAVDLRFSPPKALRGARLTLQAQGGGARVERDLSDPTTTVMLTVGAWQLDATSRRYEAHRALTIVPGQPPIDIVLTRRPRPTTGEQLARDNTMVFAAAGTMGVAYFAGIGVMLGGTNLQSRAESRDEELRMDPAADLEAAYPTAEYHGDLRRGANLNVAGAFTAMAGLGGVFGVLPILTRARTRALKIELGVSAALLVGGASWFAWYIHARDRVLDRSDPASRLPTDDDTPYSGHGVAASMFTGGAVGMLVFSTAALLRQKYRRNRLSLAPLTAPRLGGLALRGRF